MDLKASRDDATSRWTLEGVEPSAVTFERICKMISTRTNFKFARYGDGEFFCMSGKVGRNCDKHEYFPDLGQALNEAFYSHPGYMVGIQPLSVHGGLYQRALEYGLGPRDIYDADVLHSASIDGKLNLFWDALKDRRNVHLVGPWHLMYLKVPIIDIADVNCWHDYERVCDRMSTIVHNSSVNDQPVFLLCASMMSEVLIHTFQGQDCTVIDCGSVFDPYTGKFSRSYHHKLKLDEHQRSIRES